MKIGQFLLDYIEYIIGINWLSIRQIDLLQNHSHADQIAFFEDLFFLFKFN
jgi:hypothetical protein